METLKTHKYMESPRIHVYGQADNFNGWGLHTSQAVNILGKRASVSFSHHTSDLYGGPVAHPYSHRPDGSCVLQISPITTDVIDGAIVWTMHESSHILPECVSYLQKAKAILVPSMWNLHGFVQSGVTRPIYLARLGFDETIFQFEPKFKRDVYTFGAGGSISGAGQRKEVQKIVDAFHKLDLSWARLSLKLMPWDNINTYADPRIDVYKEVWSDQWVAKWYHTLDCFVSASRGEGVGLMPLQAMVCGCDVMAPLYGGHLSYMHKSHVYDLPFGIIEASGFYISGQQCYIQLNDITNTMNRVARFSRGESDESRLQRSQKRSKELSHMTWTNSVHNVLDIINEVLLTR